jgi:hypothetical protein
MIGFQTLTYMIKKDGIPRRSSSLRFKVDESKYNWIISNKNTNIKLPMNQVLN